MAYIVKIIDLLASVKVNEARTHNVRVVEVLNITKPLSSLIVLEFLDFRIILIVHIKTIDVGRVNQDSADFCSQIDHSTAGKDFLYIVNHLTDRILTS